MSADVNESDAAVSDDQQTESTEPDSGESAEQGTASNAPAGNNKPQSGNDKPQTEMQTVPATAAKLTRVMMRQTTEST